MRLVSLFLVVWSLPALARADDAILILDASKSMRGRVHGKTKSDIARRVVGELLSDIPADRRLGFVAYGHRRESDCSDIEELVPVGGERARIKSSLAALAFKGQTPLTAAVRFAADKLHYSDQKATVILVSDGIESCKADPCAAGAELEKAGIDLTVHVVGFGITKRDESRGLKCLAEATGGKYFGASDAAELSRALQETVAAKPPIGRTESATISAPASVQAGSTFDLTWTGQNDRDTLLVFAYPGQPPGALASPELFRNPFEGDGKGQMNAPAQPGEYELRYLIRRQIIAAKSLVRVTPAAATLEAPSSVPAGSTFDLSWTGPNNPGDDLTLNDANNGASYREAHLDPSGHTGSGSLQAPLEPGRYELRYVLRDKLVIAHRSIEVAPMSATIRGPASVPAGANFDASWSGPTYPDDHVVLTTPGDGPSGWKVLISAPRGSSTGQLEAPLEPGSYELRYVVSNKRVLARQPVVVTAVSATIRGPASVAAGASVDIAWTGPNYENDQIAIAVPSDAAYRSERDLSPYHGTGQGVLRAPEKPGSYELRYVLRTQRVLARQPITVRPR